MAKTKGRLLTSSDIASRLGTAFQLSQTTAKAIVGFFADTIAESLKNNGDAVILKGFISLKVAQRTARTFRNPQTGSPIKAPAKLVIKARVAKTLLGRNTIRPVRPAKLMKLDEPVAKAATKKIAPKPKAAPKKVAPKAKAVVKKVAPKAKAAPKKAAPKAKAVTKKVAPKAKAVAKKTKK